VTSEPLDGAARVLAKACVVEVAATGAKDRVARRHETVTREVVERGEQLALREIAGRSEYDH